MHSEANSVSCTDQQHDSNAYWKLWTILLLIAFFISMMAHAAGVSSASASEAAPASLPNALAFQQANAQQHLSVGGFSNEDGVACFVLVNEQGQRVGTLPMNTAAYNDQLSD